MTLEYLKNNKERIKAEKLASYKEADAVAFVADIPSESVEKNSSVEDWQQKDQIHAKCVINACGIIDSHNDLHLKGIWDDFLKTKPTRIAHLQEHKKTFDAVIAKGADLKVSTEDMSWKDLGIKNNGTTQCLVFDSTINKARNPFMFEQYAKGEVDNHSVGMRYGEIHLCVNSEEKHWKEEKTNWDTYIKEAINPEAAEEASHFWAVKSATFHEGSAVLFGSNIATPTASTKQQPKTDPAQAIRVKRLRMIKAN